MIPFFKRQTNQGGLRLYYEKTKKILGGATVVKFQNKMFKTVIFPLVSRPWGQGGCQKKQKTSRNSNF